MNGRLERAGVIATSAIPIAGWVIVVPMLAIAATQVFGVTGGRLMAAAQALTPYLLLPAIPVAIAALCWQRWALGIAATAVVVVLAGLSWPLMFPPGQPTARAAAEPLQVLHSNALYRNATPDEAAETLLSSGADVLVVTEYAPRFAAAMSDLPKADDYPYRIEHVAYGAAGTAIWSRYPMREQEPPDTHFRTVVGDVSDPNGGTLRIVGVHPPTPTGDYDNWRGELRQLDDVADHSMPMVMIGDFNASWWHPEFRKLLDDGFRDAHQLDGHGFSVSWPTKGRIPAFVRLDHALINERLVVDDVDDVDVPGSDHRGFVVTVLPAA